MVDFTVKVIQEILKNVKESEGYRKIDIKRAENKRFSELTKKQQLTFFLMSGLWNEQLRNFQKEFLIKMMSIYLKQNCSGGQRFEDLLCGLYKNGTQTARNKIGILLDEGFYDIEEFTYDVMKYIDAYCRNKNINVESLIYDVLNWKIDRDICNRWMEALLEKKECKGE
ncbi:hypothetical protein [Frisingicoccus sp.]|uniref:hypothetical protein n=1 Tax=Frisingicoccus sp. TaxID=1918627 RepID=UPI00399BFCD8